MVIDEIAGIEQELCFNEVDSTSILELLNLHCKDLSDNNLVNADQQHS